MMCGKGRELKKQNDYLGPPRSLSPSWRRSGSMGGYNGEAEPSQMAKPGVLAMPISATKRSWGFLCCCDKPEWTDGAV
jgi:hypothetical protein